MVIVKKMIFGIKFDGLGKRDEHDIIAMNGDSSMAEVEAAVQTACPKMVGRKIVSIERIADIAVSVSNDDLIAAYSGDNPVDNIC